MPNKNNAKKALRQTAKRTERNNEIRKKMKVSIKEVEKALKAGEATDEKLRIAQKALDKAAKNRVINKNTASRKLSRLVKKVQKNAK